VTEADFRSIFREHKEAVYRFAWRMTGSPSGAEDVTQDCFLALLRAPDRFDAGRGSIRAFLFGVARNLILKRWRAESRWDPLEDDSFVAEPLAPERKETAELVAQAVRLLPPLQREALILTEYEEMTLEEVARAVDAEAGTVKSRLHRARENLRRMLAPLRRSACKI
jgi:RNA polymerase sigma-70 factor, ECF subfamily